MTLPAACARAPMMVAARENKDQDDSQTKKDIRTREFKLSRVCRTTAVHDVTRPAVQDAREGL